MKYPAEESATLEFKKIIPENDQIIKAVIGFCNQKGGKLIIGVDANGLIVGISKNDVQKTLEYINKSIFEACSPPIIPLIYMQVIADKTLLIIEVSSGMNKPYYRTSEGLEKGTYIRLGRSTLRATSDIIEELKWQSRGYVYDMMPVYHATIQDLNERKILEFLNARKAIKLKTLSQEVLSSYHLILEEHTMIYPSIAGMLLFGNYPQKFFSEAMMICSHFSGVEGRNALASIDCEGTLFEQFDTAFNFILSKLERSFNIKGPKREEILEIPQEAIREVLLNAIVHRNYHIKGPIKVAIYDNRIEIFSPGGFPGPINVNNLGMGLTYIRNTAICKVFREAGYIEKLGSGFLTLFSSYKSAGLSPPQVIEGENFIKCILPRKSFAVTHSSSDKQYEDILGLFEIIEEASISDIIEALKLTRSTALRRLSQLVAKGSLIQIGKGKSVRYRKC
jgi:ATP-dependent DNA helicase RecG